MGSVPIDTSRKTRALCNVSDIVAMCTMVAANELLEGAAL
jgi:hypothetical protein